MRFDEVEAWLRRPAKAWVWVIAVVGLALLFGYLTTWLLFEYDVFWQVRAGREICSGSGVQHVERWSYTAQGRPWINFQWLATVVDYLVYRLGHGYGALSYLRGTLVTLWILALGCLVHRGAGNSRLAAMALFVLLPCVYVACTFRLQMRPDLFAAGLYAGLVVVWTSSWSRQSKRVTSLALLLLWANFHSGTFPFGLLFFCAAVWFDQRAELPETQQAKGLWMATAAATWLLTPLGYNFIHPFFGTIFSRDWATFGNPDNQPFSLELLEFRRGGFSLQLWALYTALATVCVAHVNKAKIALPGIYHQRPFVLVMASLLTLAVFWRIRAIHYQMVFLLPVVAACLVDFSNSAALRIRGATVVSMSVAAVLLWAKVLPVQVTDVGKPLGARVHDGLIPVQSVAFLKATRPKGRLWGSYPFGGYLIGELPEYPVALDGREVPFLDVIIKSKEAGTRPELNAAFLRSYDVNALLIEPPGMTYHPQYGFGDTHMVMYPPQEWAQVFFDNASVVYLRRIPDNQRIIEQHEYKVLRRGLPANFGASFAGIPDLVRNLFEGELDRCLAENPRCVYCLIGKAAFLKRQARLAEALVLLERALTIEPASVEVWVEMTGVYESLGRPREAAAAKQRFEALAGPPGQ